MNRETRIAVTEVCNVMALLTKAETEHARELAVLVSARLLYIEQHGVTAVGSAADLLPWFELARKLQAQEAQAAQREADTAIVIGDDDNEPEFPDAA